MLAWPFENVPREQVAQALARVSENVPDRHALQFTFPLEAAKVPAAHELQMDDETAPEIVANVPASQFWQVMEVLEPWPVENLPGRQFWHISGVVAACAVEYVPD